MKKTAETDRHTAAKIQKYIADIKQILSNDNIGCFQELRRSLSAKYAITQLITNIYETARRFREEALKTSLPTFSNINLKRTRQLASHDYMSIDFKPVFEICQQLMSKKVREELERLVGKEFCADEHGEY
jgi:uncharacterized protein with HEPN domain